MSIWSFDGPFGGHQTQTQENPLQWLLRVNQEKGGAVLDALGNIPKVIQEIPGRIQQGAGNLLKIGQDSLNQVVETAVEQQEQRKTNLEAGGTTEFTQQLKDNAEMLLEGATGAGWLDVAGVGLMEASGADWMPKPLRLPLLVGGMGLSAADGTPPPLSPKQLKTLSRVSPTARKVVKPKSKRVLLTEAEKRAKRRQHQANRKFREALPSDADLLSEFKAQGMPEELIPLYKKNARSGWNRTRKAASQQTVDTHAGHQRNLLASGDPLKEGVSKLDTTATTGRTAKLEYGPDNLKKGAREGSMNQHVSDITGMPSNWRKDIKQWYQHHRGEPSLHYDSDWTVEQMDLLEAIPENWSKSKVMARIEQIRQLTPTTAGQQYKAIQKELAEEMMRESQRLNDLF